MSTTPPGSPPQEFIDLELRCPVQTGVLNPLRTFIATLARQSGFSEEQVEQIEMAVDEACANVVRHAYKHLGVSCDLPAEEQSTDKKVRSSCLLRLRVEIGEGCLRVSIIDTGIGAHNKPKGVESLQEYQEREGRGGLGIYIIRKFMDEVEYETTPESGTMVTMTKFVTPAAKTAEK